MACRTVGGPCLLAACHPRHLPFHPYLLQGVQGIHRLCCSNQADRGSGRPTLLLHAGSLLGRVRRVLAGVLLSQSSCTLSTLRCAGGPGALPAGVLSPPSFSPE